MGAIALVGALWASVLPPPVRAGGLLLPWLVALVSARRLRWRGVAVAAAVGALMVFHHVHLWGPAPALSRRLRGAEAQAKSLLQELSRSSQALSGAPSAEALDRVLATHPGAGVLVGDGEYVWAGRVQALPPSPGEWVVLGPRGGSVALDSSMGQRRTVVWVPVRAWAPRDTVVGLSQAQFVAHVRPPARTWPLLVVLACLATLEALRLWPRKGWACLLVVATRVGFWLATSPHGRPSVVATHFPLLEDAPQLVASCVAILVISWLALGARQPARSPLATLAGACGAALTMGALWRAHRAYCALPVLPLEGMLSHPGVWAWLASGVVLVCTLALVASRLPWLLVVLGTLAWWRTHAWVDGAWWVPWSAAAVLLVRGRGTVGRGVAVALVASMAVLPAAWREIGVAQREELHQLATRLATDQRPWFRLVAKAAVAQWTGGCDPLDLWERTLRGLPVAGQVCVEDSGVVRRVTFGLRHDPHVPALAETTVVWEEVTEELQPPRVVVNAARHEESRRAVVSLVADLAGWPQGAFGPLADGSPWPPRLSLWDLGMLSQQDLGAVEMGWERRPGGWVLRFQREYADGPHVVELAWPDAPRGVLVASVMATTGFTVLLAALVLVAVRLWGAGWEELFFRYRDRLVPVMASLGVAPVVLMASLSPSLERAAREETVALHTVARCREVTTAYRVELVRRAAELAAHTPHASSASVHPIPPPGHEGAEAALPEGLVRVVAEGERSAVWVAGDPAVAYALVPHAQGALLVATPLDDALRAALGGTEQWTAAVWRGGKLAAAVLSPLASRLPALPPNPRQLSGSVHQLRRWDHPWAFSELPDDLRGEGLILGVRWDGAWAPRERASALWAWAILLPVGALTGLMASMASRVVSRPISLLAQVASRVGTERPVEWPRFTGEVGELASALERMARRLAASMAEVSREKARLEAILAHLGAGVVVVDSTLSVVMTNPAVNPLLPWLAGDTSPPSLAGGPLHQVVAEAIGTGTTRSQTLGAPDQRLWQVSVAPLQEQGLCTGAVVVLEDTTQVVEREKLMAWAQFARVAAHELKNPLTPIKLAAQHLRRAFHDGAPSFPDILAQTTEMIQRQTERMERFLKDLGSLSKAAGQSPGTVDVGSLVAQVVADYAPYSAQGIRVSLRAQPPQALVWGDAEALRTVCMNIVDNAVKAMEQPGDVVVEVSLEDEWVVLRCDDQGVGIPPQFLEKVFEPGFSLRPGGTGLGLAISRSVVNAHGGSIRLLPLERGTRAEVRLPRWR